MKRIVNSRAGPGGDIPNELSKLKRANQDLKILQPSEIERLASLLTQDTVGKDELKEADRILKDADQRHDECEDQKALEIAKDLGIDWTPADGYNSEVQGELLTFGATVSVLRGIVQDFREGFPTNALDELKSGVTKTRKLFTAIPVGIAVAVGSIVRIARGDRPYNKS